MNLRRLNNDRSDFYLVSTVQSIRVLTSDNVRLKKELEKMSHFSDGQTILIRKLQKINEELVFSTLKAYAEVDESELKLVSLKRSSQRDSLTGTANRPLMLECINQSIAATKRHRKNFALLFIDLDHFKPVNDRFGHCFGDQLLKKVAERLGSVIRESDVLSRHGGDEFLVLLNEISGQKDVIKVVRKIKSELTRSFIINNNEINLSASVGFALYPQDGIKAETLIRRADQAMYRVKSQGGDGFSR